MDRGKGRVVISHILQSRATIRGQNYCNRMRQPEAPRMIRVQFQGRGERSRGWLTAALLLAAGGWTGLTDARAGCSHLVTTKADATRLKVVQIDRLVSTESLVTELGRSLPLEDHSAPPCSGYMCSDNSVPLAPLAAPRSLPRIDAWSRLDLSVLSRRDNSAPFSCDDDRPLTLDRVERLARPPR
jgi:hypothetical protein